MNETNLTRPFFHRPTYAYAALAGRLARMLLAMLVATAFSVVCAEEYTADRIGDWDIDAADNTTLAGALRAAAAGETIALDGDLGGAWDNWPAAGGGYVLFKPGATLASGESVTIDLSGHSLSGAALSVGSGAGDIVFANGSLGDAGDNFRVGAGESGRVTLSGVDLEAADLMVNGMTAGTLTATNGSTLAVSSVTLTLVNGKIDLVGSSLTSGGAVTVSSGAAFAASDNAEIAIGGNLSVGGVAAWEIEASPGTYGYRRTTFSGSGELDFTGSAIVVSGGADVDLSGFTLTGVGDIGAGETLTVKDVWAHSEGGVSFQSTLTLSGALNVAGAGAVVNIAGGGLLRGLSGISVGTGGSVTVGGAVNDADSGKLYRSEIASGGGLAIAGGTVAVTDGGLISGIVDGVSITGGGALRIDGVNAAANYRSEVRSTGDLSIGSSGTGDLEITGGGSLVSAAGLFGQGDGEATVDVKGVGTGNNRSTLSLSGGLVANTSTVTIQQGALLDVAGDAVLGDAFGSATSWTLGGRGGTGSGYAASLIVGGTLTVGDEGTATIAINHGGSVQSGGATILGGQGTARTTIVIEDNDGTSGHYAWVAGGTAVAPDEYVAPSGNAGLVVKDGTLQIKGLFAMAGQNSSYVDGFGLATFGGTKTAELHMSGGSFYNRDATGEIGRIEFNAGSVVSGSGNIYAGDVFVVDGGTIAPGTRWMYHFDKSANDRLTSLGVLHLHDNAGNDTLFHNAAFRTELDRGEQPNNADGLSDKVVVHGNLKLDENFTIDISRPLDGKYLLVETDGGSISNFTPRDLSNALTGDFVLNLNGKTLKGNDRIDRAGGMFTTIEDGDKIYLTVDTTSGGNVKTYWTGDAAGTVWDMKARNFDAMLAGNPVFTGDDQFLDGDIVVFDFSKVTDAAKRVVNVTTDATKYSGDMSTVGNVRVAEVSVLGGAAGVDTLVWQGGSIFAYDSALYSTLDQVATGESPSGKMIKIGSGTLEIRNANEFYGGVHLGDPGGGDTPTGDQLGGLIVLENARGFGTYNSLSGYQNRGVVYVHQNATIDVTAVGSITNRFIVSPGKILTFLIDGQFSISGNNALAGDSVNQGKGGGIYIGNEGQVVYQGDGGLKLTNNFAHQGGGIYTQLGYTLQVPAVITGNYASRQGGGIFAEKFFQLQDGSTISGNRAQSAGGGIFVGNLNTFEAGDDRKFHLHGNTTISNNLSGGATGGGIYVDAGRELVISTAKEATFKGGDVWFEGNYAMIGFDADNPTGGTLDMTNAYRNALHLSNKSTVAENPAAPGATLNITGPYNTYFYDAISGDVGTKVTITGVLADNGVNTSHALSASQKGTVVFHADSAFYGATAVKNGATFRLETYGADEAIYGRRGSLHPDAAAENAFSIDALSSITGHGTIAADKIRLDGIVDLDTGLFGKPDGRDGSGALVDAGTKQGVLNLDGEVTLADTAAWFLNLGTGNTTDTIAVTGDAEFLGATAGQKLALDIDSVVRGKYAVMTTTGGVTGFNADKLKSDAVVTLNGGALNLAGPATMDPFHSRAHVATYVENKNLYLDIGGRNRHVIASAGGNWGYNPGWSFDASYIPVNVGGGAAWAKNDGGPATGVYLDGDMVTLAGVPAGSTYTLTSDVKPVDLFVTGANAVTIDGAFGIRTYSTGATAAASDTRGKTDTTIRESGSAEANDYGIDKYTGRLYKRDGGVLTFANTGGNVFTHGIEIGVAGGGGDGGTIVFNRGDQLGVGSGAYMDFINNGTLNAIATTDLAAAIRIADTMTATFDVAAAAALTQTGVVSNLQSGDGSIEKTGEGTLKVAGANSFTGGTEFLAGTLEIGNNSAFGSYASASSDAGVIFVNSATAKIFAVNDTYTAKNRFIVDSLANNQLTMIIAGGKTFTISNVDAGTANGGVVLVGDSAQQAAFTGGGNLTITGSKAASGGAIYTGVASALSFDVVARLNSNTAATGAGGALYAADGVSFARAATLTGNTAATSGGAIYAGDDVVFSAAATLNTNTATSAAGGAIFTLGDARFSAAASFASNKAANATGGAIHAGGDVVFSGNATLNNNTAANAGGGVHATSGSVSFNGTTNTITNNKANSAVASTAKGGAVYAQNISVSGNATITGNASTYRGGALYVEGGTLTLTPANAAHTIAFSGNTAADGDNGEAVYLAGGADLAIAGAGSVVFNNTVVTETAASTFVKNGTGTVLFTGDKKSVFSGNTTVNAGEFRIASGSSYLNAGAANTFTLVQVPVAGKKSDGAFLTGGGTIKAGRIELHGVVAPDSDKSTSVPAAIAAADRIGSLTLDGDVAVYGNSEANSYQFDFDLQQKENATPLTRGDSDVLVVTGGDFSVGSNEKIIFNLHNFGKGKFLLIDVQDGALDTGSFTGVNGIGESGAFDILIHDFVKTDRHKVEFMRGDETLSDGGVNEIVSDAANAANQLWLATQYNNLYMYWTGAENAVWDGADNETNGNWLDKIGGETHFENADTVVFGDAAPGGANPARRTIDVHADGVVVTGMVVDTSASYTFTGTGGIGTTNIYAGDILDAHYAGGSGSADVPRTLAKKGTGTLEFRNTGGNAFAGGIVVEGGTLAFNRGNQLGDGGKGITFTGTAGLEFRANGDAAIALANNIILADGITATIGAVDGKTLTMSGKIDAAGTTANLVKSGGGTLVLSNADNDWRGTTTVSGGTLRAGGVAALGRNTAANEIVVANAAELEIDVAAGSETLNKQVTGAGKLEKTGGGTLVLNHAANSYAGGTAITGGTIVAETLNSIGSNVAGGTVSMASATALELKLDAAEGGLFAQRITGAGKLIKSDAGLLELSRSDNNYTGGTEISGGGIKIANVGSLGANASASVVNLNGASTTLEFASAAGTFNHAIQGSGSLIKSGAETLTLTGSNTFSGGATLSGGGIVLGSATAAGAYSGAGKAGQIDFTGDGTTVTSNLAQSITNRFVVGPGVTGAGLSASANLVIENVISGGGGGGAVVLTGTGIGNTEFTINANADVTFRENKSGASRNDVTMGSNAALNLTGSGNIFFGGGIEGTGAVTKTSAGIAQIAANSSFSGATDIEAGAFRVVQGVSYGSGAMGSVLTLDAGATLAGGGTVKVQTITISGTISADAATFSSGDTTIASDSASRYGTLTLESRVGVTLDGFTMDYNVGTAHSSSEYTSGLTTGDLLKLTGGGTYELTGGTINFKESVASGSYLIIHADGDIGIGANALDGIKGGGVLAATGVVSSHTPRGDLAFVWGGAAHDDHSQIWLDVDRNSLTMNWNQAGGGTFDWNETSANWQSVQTRGGTRETVYNDGDLVNIAVSAATTLNTSADRLVSGLAVTGAGDLTLGGPGTIEAKTSEAGVIEGQYLLASAGAERLVPTGKLVKSGAGTLSFANGDVDNGNTFAQGIEISGGVIAFQRANQLGDGGNGIAFTGSAGLAVRADGDAVLTLGNDIGFTNGITATFDTNGKTLTLSGAIDQAGTTAGLTKAGSGTLILTNAANDWQGTTTVSGGTLRAVGVAALGRDAAAGQIAVAGAAELEIDVASGSQTLLRRVTGAGAFEKTGAGALVLNNAGNSYAGGTAITGGRIIAETLGSVGNNVAGGTVDMALGTVLELKLDATEGGAFAQKLTGAGKLVKSGTETLYLANAGNAYSGGTDIAGGRVEIASVAAIGTGAINMSGTGTSLKLDLSADGELAQTVSGLGALVKTGSGAVTLAGANSYSGGTDLGGGGIVLGSATAVGVYTGAGKSGQIDFTGNNTTVASNRVQDVTNRFVVGAGVTGAKLETTEKLGIQNVAGGASGGAVVLGAGSEFTINAGADLTFAGNTKSSAANDVTMGAGSVLTLAGTGDIFLGGGIDGSGTVTKSNTGITQIGGDSAFSGTTAVNAGTFRIVEGARYGAGGGGSAFSLAAGKTLSGGGAVKAETITLAGTVSADKATLSSGGTTVAEADKFATLSLEGNVTLKSGFTLEYDAKTPNDSVSPTGDLLAVSGGQLTIEQGGTINVRSGGSALTGSYHIIDADQAIALSGGSTIEDVLTTTINGNAISGYSVRGTFSLSMKASGTEVWLDVDHNSLNMVWDDSPATSTWSASAGGNNWTSKQGGAAPLQAKEKGFSNGDYVHFTGAGGQTITVDGAIEIAGFEFNSAGDYTFTGTGTIGAADDLASTEGKFLPAGTGSPTLTPDGKLIKSGSGTLTFANGTAAAGNTFAEGIEISGGVIAFNRANQLGDGGNGITFLNSAGLRANAGGDAVIELANKLVFSDGITATLDSGAQTLKLSGAVDQAGTSGALTKTGAGTLVVSNAANNWKGATTVSGGTLRAEGVEALGDNAAARAVAVGGGAELEIDVAAGGETLRKRVTGAGALEKTGAGTLVLDHADNSYTGGTTITAGRIVAETLASVGGNAAAGTVTVASSGSVLELKLDAGEGGAFAQRIAGSGMLAKSGAETLTLNRSDNSYAGGTDIAGGRIAITNTGAVGANVAGGVVAMTGSGTSFEINLAADGEFNQKIAGVGQLVKSAASTVTLTNANAFGGGTLLEAGAIVLGHAEALAKTDGVAGSLAGQVFVNNDATVFDSAGVHAVQNRFEVAANRHLTLDAGNGAFAIAGNSVDGADGGAIELKSGAGFTTTDSTHLSGNSAGGGGGAIYAPDAAIIVGGRGANTVASISGNTAGQDGGGVYAKSVTFNAQSGGTTVSGNAATAGEGGAAYLTGGVAGTNAVSTLSAALGDLAFSGNTASGVANAIHMDKYATLQFVGGHNIDMLDSISSTAGSGRGNLIHIAMAGNADAENNAVNLHGDSAYYGDTRLEKGVVRLNNGAHFGAASSDSAFRQEEDGALMGVGTIEAKTIELGGLINAGEFTTASAADIRTLGFVGAVAMGDLGIGQTRLNVDIDGLTNDADLVDITGTLALQGETLVDFNTFSLGKYLLAQTSGGVSGHTPDGHLDGELKISDFVSTVGGATLNPGRFYIDYTLENGGKDIYVTMHISNNYIVWTGANENDPTFSGGWPFVGDDDYENKWLNDPLYNWQTVKNNVETPVRFRQGDMVAFDSVSDAAKNPGNYLEVRENIEIVTHATDDSPSSGDAKACVADMLVTGGGTYRFTGRGISAALDTANTNFEDAGGQLVVNGGSTAVFANAANNFQRGILLQNGAVAFDDPDQLGTLFVDDLFNNGVTASHGITVEGENSYGRLIANADNMELGIAVSIERDTSAFVVDTGGIGFGNAAAVGSHTLILKHAAVDSHTDPAAPGGPTPVNGIHGLGQLVKTGAGTLILADANSYEGGTVVEQGTLAIAHDNRLGKSGSGVLLDGGVLRALDTLSSSRAVVVGDAGGGVEVDDGKMMSLGGLVVHDPAGSAPGTLFKTGEGTLFLANANNTFAGDIVVEAGALRVSATGAFGAADTPRTLTIDAGALGDGSARVEVELAAQTGHAGREWLEMELKGSGELVKEGAGILALGADSLDFTGALTVKAGTLEVMGDMRNVTQIVIDDGAVLCGSGVLGSAALGKVAGGGTIKPCGVTGYDPTRPDASPSATTLTFYGDLDFNCDSIYDIVITQCPAGANSSSGRYDAVSDCLVVTSGLVTIDPGATLNVTIDYWGDTFTAFDFCEDSSGPFTIIDATDASVTNAGDMFLMNEIELPRGVEIAHGWNDGLYQIWFVGNPTGSFTSAATNPNQREVGAILEEAAVGRDPGLKDLVQILSQKEIDDDILRRAMTELSGDLRVNALLHKQPWRHPFGRIVQERDALPGAFGRPETPADEAWSGFRTTNWRSWAEVYQRYADVNSDSNALGYTMRRPGVVLGFDRFIGNHALVGLAFNYSNPDVRQSTGKVKIDDYELGLYGNIGIGTAWNLNLYGGISRQRYDATRRVFIPAGSKYGAVSESFSNKTDGHGVAASAELSWSAWTGDRLRLSPVAAIDYEKVTQDGYLETGGLTALRYGKARFEKLMARAGLDVSIAATERFGLTAGAHYVMQVAGDNYAKGSAVLAAAETELGAMSIRGVRVGRNYVNLNLGGKGYLNRKKTLSWHIQYNADIYRRTVSHTGNLGLMLEW